MARRIVLPYDKAQRIARARTAAVMAREREQTPFTNTPDGTLTLTHLAGGRTVEIPNCEQGLQSAYSYLKDMFNFSSDLLMLTFPLLGITPSYAVVSSAWSVLSTPELIRAPFTLQSVGDGCAYIGLNIIGILPETDNLPYVTLLGPHFEPINIQLTRHLTSPKCAAGFSVRVPANTHLTTLRLIMRDTRYTPTELHLADFLDVTEARQLQHTLSIPLTIMHDLTYIGGSLL